VFTYFILIFANFGFNSSIIYHRNLSKQDLATCWWGNLAVDGLAALLCVGFAFGTRRFVHSSEVSWVIALLALQFLLVSAGSVNASLMRRAFMFKKIAIVNVVGSVATFVAALIGVTLLGWGIYGLVAGMVFASLVMSVMQMSCMPWLPSRSFGWASLRKHVRYGRWFVGVSLVNYTNNNIDKFWIGTLLSSSQLGYYEYAISIPLRTTQELGQIINSVLFPAYSSLQNDLAQLRHVIVKTMRYTTLIVFPILVGLTLVADDFVTVAYGEKWRPIIAPLQLFCLLGLWRVAFSGLFSLCYGMGKPHLPFKWSAIALPLNGALLYFAVRTYGVLGVALAKGFLDLFMLSTLRTEAMRAIALPLERQLRAILPALVGCLLMALPLHLLHFTHLASGASPLVRLLVEVMVGAVTYVVAVFGLWRSEFSYLCSLPKELLSHP
jgi:O-antigen/teichoic acid export membrane protein